MLGLCNPLLLLLLLIVRLPVASLPPRLNLRRRTVRICKSSYCEGNQIFVKYQQINIKKLYIIKKSLSYKIIIINILFLKIIFIRDLIKFSL
jgi:hypothetical protein